MEGGLSADFLPEGHVMRIERLLVLRGSWHKNSSP